MRKFLTLCAIALAAFSCATPYEQIPEETIQDPSGAKSILPDEIQVTTDGAPTTKAGAIDGYDAGFLGNENKLKFYWDNGDQIDIFGYDDTYHSYVRSALYEVYNLSGGAYNRFTATIKKQSGYLISETFSLNGDVNSVGACVAIYPAGLVSADYGQEHYNGAWTNPTNDDPNHYVKMNLPSRYTLDATSIANDDQYVNVRGMKSQAPMLGLYANTNSIVFHHLEGILKIDFTGIADGVKYYKVTTPGKKINGEYNVPINAKENPRPCIALQSTEDPDEETIVFEYESALDYGNDTKNHVLYIPLPVGTYDKGITVGVYNEDNVLVGQWGVTSLTINRGTLAYTSSFAVERIINAGNAAVINFSECVGAYEDKPTKGVAVNFEDVNHEQNVTLTYGDNLEQKPKYVYIAGNDHTNVGVVSGNLNASTVEFLGGKFAGTDLITAANTLNIRQGATVGNINISGGNARVFGKYQNIVVAENATADGVSAPVNVTINPTATAMTSARPTVTVKAPTNLVIAKPEGSTNTTITYVDVVVAATTATTAETALSNITVGENVNVHIVAATGTDVNIETVDAKTDTDTDGAITIDPATPETQGDITSIWDGTSKSPLTETDGIYYIYTAAQLAQLAEDVNSKTNYYAGKTVKLMCNIDLDNNAWTPIGLGGENANDDKNNEVGVFLGTFDGNGKTISNLKATHENDDRSFAGLFGNITSINHAVTIQNLTVSGVDIHSEHMAAGILGRYCGAGNNASLVIDHCQVVGTDGHNTITSVPFENGNITESGNQAAGIVGNAYGKGTISITNCSVDNVNINGARDLGGIAGFLDNNVVLTSNAVSNTTITQSYPDNYEAGKDMSTVHEVVGRTGITVVESNTTENVTIILQDGTVVARIGNTNYTSLAAAFAAVQDGQTIVLMKNHTQDEGILFNKENVSAKFDLNDHTLTVNNGSNINNRAIRIDNGSLEVYDGSIVAVGAGTTSSNGTGCYGAFRVEANGKLVAHDLTLTNSRPWGLNVKVLGGEAELTNVTINSSYGGGIEVTEANLGTQSKAGSAELTNCTFTQTGYFDHCSTTLSVSGGSELIVNSGSYTSENYALYVFSSGGVITVKGGEFSGNKNGIAIIAAIDTHTYPQYEGGLQISDGTVNGGFSITSPAYMSITGGTYDHDPSAYVAEGYEAVYANNLWTVQEAADVAQIGEVKYQTLAAAVAAATSGQTIKILKNFTIEGNAGVEIPAGKTITLDLNGKTIKNLVTEDEASQLISNKGTLTITDSSAGANGTMTNEIADGVHTGAWTGYNYSTSIISNAGTLIIENGNINQVATTNISYSIDNLGANTSTTVNGGNLVAGYIPIRSFNGQNKSVAIHGGTLTGLFALYLQSTTTLTIDGGTFNAPTRNAIYVDAASTINISGDCVFNYVANRQFVAFDNDNVQNGSTVSVTGGTFSSDPAAFVAAGYESYQDGSVWKIHEAQGVAKIGTASYASLAAAVAAAQSGDTIELIADDDSLTDGSELEINKSLTITGATKSNGEPLYTITGKSSVTGTNDIFITGNGNVTLSNLKVKNFGNNVNTDQSHAPIYVSTNFTGTVNLENVYVSDFNRGGIFLYGGEFNVNDCYIDCANSRSGAFTKGIEIKGSAHGTISETFICNMERSGSDSPAGIEIYGNGSIEVDNCTIVSDNGDHAANKATYGIASSRVGVHNPSGGTTHIHDCMFETTNACLSVTDSDAYGPVNNYTFIVDDCDFNTYIATWSTTSSITINSGSFAENVYADAGTITIHGGEFANFAPYAGSSGSIIIYGGVFDADPSTYVAEGYAAVEEDGLWTVSEIQGVAKIGTTNYASLAAAIAAVPTDGTKTTIQMIANETMATGATLEVASTKNIVLDLNGKTVSGNGGVNGANFFFLTNRGTLEITDSSTNKDGKITGAWTNPDTGWSKQFNTIYNIDGKLTLSAGTVEVTTGNLSYAINNSSNAWGAGDNKETVFTMTGGTVTAPSGDAAVRVYQNCGSNSNPYSHNTLNISGGLIKDSGIFIDTYIYKANPASSGDHINTSINISGGEIHGLIDLKMRHPYNTSVNITNGTFRSSTFRVRKYVDEWGTGLAEPTAPVFNISNGDFQFASSTPSNAFSIMRADQPSNVWSTYANQFSITGGTYSVDPSAYVATGYEAVQNGNVWIINQNTGNANGGSTGGGQNNPGF